MFFWVEQKAAYDSMPIPIPQLHASTILKSCMGIFGGRLGPHQNWFQNWEIW